MSCELLRILGSAETSDNTSCTEACPVESSTSPQLCSNNNNKRGPRIRVRRGEEILHLDNNHISKVIDFIQKSVSTRWMAHGCPSKSEPLDTLLREKERDLELAAKIGQSLLEQNKELQTRNEFLEENLSQANETLVQLKHEVHKRSELLRVYSHLDEESGSGVDESLRLRVNRLSSENDRLRHEHATLRKQTEQLVERERKSVTSLTAQLEYANERSTRLQTQIQEKNDECIAQAVQIERLLKEIRLSSQRERHLTAENGQLGAQLEEALKSHEILSTEVAQLQDMYAEVKGMFHDAEEELRQLRQKSSPYRSPSIDSLYDSLASELENSDSGFSSTPFASSRSNGVTGLRLELQNGTSLKEHEEVDVPSAVLADLARKKVSICDSAPAPPQTPQSENTTPTHLVPAVQENLQEEIETSAKEAEHIPEKVTVEKPMIARVCIETQTIALPELKPLNSTLDTQNSPTLAVEQEKQTTPDTVSGEGNLEATTQVVGTTHVASRTTQCVPPNTLPLRSHSMEGSSTMHVWKPTKKSLPARTSSQDSLSEYEAPKMGEPGVPGTRDLDYSIRQLNVRRQQQCTGQSFWCMLRSLLSWLLTTRRYKMEREYAQFRERKGLPATKFFAETKPSTAPPFGAADSWCNYAVVLGEEHSRTVQPWRAVQHVGLAAIGGPTGGGVLSRAELPSPNASPVRVQSSPVRFGIAGILPSSSSPLSSTPDFSRIASGILSRRGL